MSSSTAAIEIHDGGILALRDGGVQPVVASPGYAVVDGKQIVTGSAARRKSRLLPRHCHSRFWDSLDRAPLPRPFPSKLTAADLAHAHLSAVWKEVSYGIDRVLLVVPGFYSDEELGLLLGIAQACEIPLSAMIDLALASAAEMETPAAIYLDVHLHRIVGARIERGVHLDREALRSDDGAGLVALENAWAVALAQKLVRETRFDPLHDAASEQHLYDRLPRLVASLAEKERETLVLQASGKDHAVEVERRELVELALPFYRRLFHLARSLDPRGSWPAVLLSSRLSALPGLVELVRKDVSPVVVELPPAVAARNALKYRARIPAARSKDASVPFAVSLSLRDLEEPAPLLTPPTTPREPAERVPTHVLHEGVAHPIEPPFHLGARLPAGAHGLRLPGDDADPENQITLVRENGRLYVEDRGPARSFLNGERLTAAKTAVTTGDILRLGSTDVLLIEVRD